MSIRDFPLEAKRLAQTGQTDFVPKKKNLDGMAQVAMLPKDIWDIVMVLAPEHLYAGPLADDQGRAGEIWVFNASGPAGCELYLKLKIRQSSMGKCLVCLSCHPPDFPME